jgi:hypothetical protein
MKCNEQRCRCRRGAGSTQGNMNGRVPVEPPRDYWPEHDRAPLSTFVSERNRTASMWRL